MVRPRSVGSFFTDRPAYQMNETEEKHFKALWDKGLVYEGYRVLAYCWRCQTPLSNTETTACS